MSDALERLDVVINTGRAPTQRGTIMSLMRGSCAAFEVARDLGISPNAANISLHQLVKAGVVERPLRGRYRVREGLLALHLSDRIRSLESKMIRVRSAPGRSSEAPRSASIAAAQPAQGGEPS